MSRCLLLSLSLFFARCGPAAPPAGEACMDTWLTERGLDTYGNPAGTRYAGGSPLRDEATGLERSRAAYVRERHPEFAEACPTPPST